MSGDGRDWHDIASKAGVLSDDRFLKVVRLFEQIRGEPGVGEAMQILRPRLATLKPPRRLTPDRLFFLPVEDLLDNPTRYQRRRSRVSRAALQPCWRIVKAVLRPKGLDRITADIGAAGRLDTKTLVELGAPLWKAGSGALADEIARAKGNLTVQAKVFGRDDDLMRQAGIVASATQIGATVQTLKAALPEPPITGLGDYHIDAIRTAIQEVAPQGAATITTLLMVMTARMMQPGSLLSLLAETSFGGSQDERTTILQEVRIAALENILQEASDLPETMLGTNRVTDIALAAERLVSGLDSLRSQLSAADRKKMGGRIEAAQSAITSSVQKVVIEPAEESLLGPTREMARALRGASPTDLPDQAAMGRAEEFAVAFRRASQFATTIGLQDEMAAKANLVCKEARGLATALTSSAVGPDGRWRLDPAVLDSRFVALLRLVELIAGPAEADAMLSSWEQKLTAAPYMAPR